MAWFGDRLPKHVKANNEEDLEKKLSKLSVGLQEKLEIVTIYPSKGKIVAWYFLDRKKAVNLPKETEEPTKKKKRTKKKAS